MSDQELEIRKRKRLILPPYPEQVKGTEATLVRGPLGIWNFPFLNALLQFLYSIRRAAPTPQAYFPRIATRRVEYVRNREGRIIERLEEVELT